MTEIRKDPPRFSRENIPKEEECVYKEEAAMLKGQVPSWLILLSHAMNCR